MLKWNGLRGRAHIIYPSILSVADAVHETEAVDDLTLTILIPCLNEEETLAICIEKAHGYLNRAGIAGEVVVADNGSTDRSIEIAERVGARVIPVLERGYGGALRGGIRAARGRYVIMGDADDSYDFSDLTAFVNVLQTGADLVMGNRFKGGIAPGAMPPLHRYLGNPVLSRLGRLLFRAPVGDFHCGLRGFRRTAILDLGLQTSGMEFASEMVVQASLRGLRIEEVPTELSKDGRSRPPHLNTWRDGWRHLRFLLLHSPRWTFAYPGLAMLALGLALVALLLQGQLAIGHGIGLDIRAFFVGCLGIMVGSQALTFALLARRFAARHALLPSSGKLQGVLAEITMERLLQSACGIALAGLSGIAASIVVWGHHDFGALLHGEMLRVMSLSVTAITVAVQLGLSAFLLGVMDLPGVNDARTRLPRLRRFDPEKSGFGPDVV
jgi:glycosyltransferase involved in cell wall biosynthesis